MKEDIQLVYPDYSASATPLEISTDASLSGAGACLSQVQNGQTRVMADSSISFNKTQQNYSTIERELQPLDGLCQFSEISCLEFVFFFIQITEPWYTWPI